MSQMFVYNGAPQNPFGQPQSSTGAPPLQQSQEQPALLNFNSGNNGFEASNNLFPEQPDGGIPKPPHKTLNYVTINNYGEGNQQVLNFGNGSPVEGSPEGIPDGAIDPSQISGADQPALTGDPGSIDPTGGQSEGITPGQTLQSTQAGGQGGIMGMMVLMLGMMASILPMLAMLLGGGQGQSGAQAGQVPGQLPAGETQQPPSTQQAPTTGNTQPAGQTGSPLAPSGQSSSPGGILGILSLMQQMLFGLGQLLSGGQGQPASQAPTLGNQIPGGQDPTSQIPGLPTGGQDPTSQIPGLPTGGQDPTSQIPGLPTGGQDPTSQIPGQTFGYSVPQTPDVSAGQFPGDQEYPGASYAQIPGQVPGAFGGTLTDAPGQALPGAFPGTSNSTPGSPDQSNILNSVLGQAFNFQGLPPGQLPGGYPGAAYSQNSPGQFPGGFSGPFPGLPPGGYSTGQFPGNSSPYPDFSFAQSQGQYPSSANPYSLGGSGDQSQVLNGLLNQAAILGSPSNIPGQDGQMPGLNRPGNSSNGS